MDAQNNTLELTGFEKVVRAEVEAWPGAVTVALKVVDDISEFTPDEARELASFLLAAANLAERVEWANDDPFNTDLVEKIVESTA